MAGNKKTRSPANEGKPVKEGKIAPARKTPGEHDPEAALVGIPLVGIIMGSDSDLPVMSEAARILERFEVPYEITIVSAHRTPSRMVDYARSAHQRGIKVIVAGAGGAAHLPGMVASLTPLPVVGVPVHTRSLQGLDSLLSIVQMPGGIPVATVAINQATNAGLLAIRILAAGDKEMLAKMQAYQEELEVQVLSKANRLETDGWQFYLSGMNEARG